MAKCCIIGCNSDSPRNEEGLSFFRFDTPALQHVCNNIIKVLSKQSPLHKESALCSRFLYKYDRKFSNDIGYRNLKKVHTALKKYLALNLIKDIESFVSALPSESDDETYLPTRQMLEYVLLRIITFSKIMLRISVCSKQSAIFYLNRLKRGESHWMTLLPYALLSRLWSMTTVLAQHSTGWYSNLYPYLNKLNLKGVKFLPENYELPHDLEEWLDLKNVENFGRFNWDQRKLVDLDASILDDDENDLFDNILNFVNKLNKTEADEEMIDDIKPLLSKDEDQLCNKMAEIDYGKAISRESDTMRQCKETDIKAYKFELRELIPRKTNKFEIGESVSRKSFESVKGKVVSRENFKVLNMNKESKDNMQCEYDIKLKPQAIKNIKEKVKSSNENTVIMVNKHNHKKVTNTQSLKEFINTEEKFRNESSERSLTGHLSLMQWHALRTALLKLCETITNRKIDKKFQKIWKEKCLDYK